MVVPFHILWPGGNTTALIDQFCPRSQQASVAKYLLEHDHSIEQVGFLEPSSKGCAFRLQMAGGEFCGNAARAAAYFWKTVKGKDAESIEISGMTDPVHVVSDANSTSIHLPESFLQRIEVTPEGFVIDLNGIRHIVIERDSPLHHSELLKKYADEYPAVGVMRLEQGQNISKLIPTVWVRDVDTVIEETGCASGSIAAAIAMSLSGEAKKHHIEQPSGHVYRVELGKEIEKNRFESFSLSGEVLYKGQRHLALQSIAPSIAMRR